MSRARSGWAVSQGSDRLVLRATLEDARNEALRLAELSALADSPSPSRHRNIHLQEVLLDQGPSGLGQLVFADGQLIALLAQVDEGEGDMVGFWFVETAFGDFAEDLCPPVEDLAFADLEGAESWIRARL